jgi:hypothetical protein
VYIIKKKITEQIELNKPNQSINAKNSRISRNI